MLASFGWSDFAYLALAIFLFAAGGALLYAAIRLGGTNYSSIEFPQEMLKNAEFENSMFGKMSDVTFLVKTKRGLAEYPSVSLSAVSITDRAKIKAAVVNILSR